MMEAGRSLGPHVVRMTMRPRHVPDILPMSEQKLLSYINSHFISPPINLLSVTRQAHRGLYMCLLTGAELQRKKFASSCRFKMQICAIYLVPPTGKKGDGSSVDTSVSVFFHACIKIKKVFPRRRFFFSRNLGDQETRLAEKSCLTQEQFLQVIVICQNISISPAKVWLRKKKKVVRISILFTDFKLFAPICLHLLKLGSSTCRIHKKNWTLGKQVHVFFLNRPIK